MAQLSNKHRNVNPFHINDLRGGINLFSPIHLLADNEARNLENWEFNSNTDQLVTRGGLSSPITTFQYSIKSVFYDYEMNVYFIFLDNKNIYKYTLNLELVLIGSLLGNERPVCCKFGGNVYIASGEKLQQYDYTSLTTIEESPLCDNVFSRFGRLVTSKQGSDDIIRSGIGDATNWTEDTDSDAWITPVGYKDGGDIIGIFPLATDIIVFKSNGKVFQLAGEPPDESVFEIAKNSDFVYKHGMCHLGPELIYLSKQGLRTLATTQEYGNYQYRDMGQKVNSELAKWIYHPLVWHITRKKQILIRPDETGKKILAFHYLLGAFTLLDFPEVISDIVESPTDTIIAMGNSLYYWSQDYSTDNGTKITAKILSKQVKSIQYILVKRLTALVDATSSGSATIKINSTEIPFNWTNNIKFMDMRLQVVDRNVNVEFVTQDKMAFNHIMMETVLL